MIMKKKYVNNLPNGKEVIGTAVSVEDGKLVVEIEFKEEFKPKDGDFLVSRNCKVFIFNGRNSGNTYGAYCGVNSFDEIVKDIHTNFWTYKEGCRFATQEEKTDFLERLEKECHKTWNEDKKKLEDIRWRANVGETYYYIGGSRLNVYAGRDDRYDVDNERYKIYNYFMSYDDANIFSNKFKEILKNSKAE